MVVEEPPDSLEAIRSQSLTGVLLQRIEKVILSGELKPGASVNENKLAARFGVSRGPIREACRGLVGAGLLVFKVNRGFFVRELSPKEVVNVYDVRIALARAMGELATERASAEQIAELRDLLGQMDEAVEDYERYYDLNKDFHDRIAVASGNPVLAKVDHELVRDVHMFRRRILVAEGATAASNEEHRHLVEALAGGDAKRAGAVLELHLVNGKTRFLASLERMRSEAT